MPLAAKASVKPPRRERLEKGCFTWAEVDQAGAVAGEPWARILRDTAVSLVTSHKAAVGAT